MHLWWSRKPLATARAVIFAQMVDDPSGYVDVLLSDTKKRRAAERELKKRRCGTCGEAGIGPRRRDRRTSADAERGHRRAGARPAIRDYRRPRSLGEHHERRSARTGAARNLAELAAGVRGECGPSESRGRFSIGNKLPAFHDPFAGGGSLPLEAQRLGLEAHASDLNPVAVLINKAMIEIPPKFAGQAPVNPAVRQEKNLIERDWTGAQGLAEDVRYYGQWMREEADKRIGHLYPPVEITEKMVAERPDLECYKGRELTVIAWLWARTVKSPNPAFADVEVPLTSKFMLSRKKGKEAYVEPVIENGSYRFTVKVGKPKDAEAAKQGTKAGGSGSIFLCLMSGTPMPFEYLRPEAKAGRMDARLMAIVAEGDRGRVYLAPNPEHEAAARRAKPHDVPETDLPAKALGFRVQEYGMIKWRDLFTPRQLVALTNLFRPGG